MDTGKLIQRFEKLQITLKVETFFNGCIMDYFFFLTHSETMKEI